LGSNINYKVATLEEVGKQKLDYIKGQRLARAAIVLSTADSFLHPGILAVKNVR
jgi:hypothetical protein